MTRCTVTMPRFPRLLPLGDSGLTIEFGDRLAPHIHDRVLACVARLEREPLRGLLEIVPTYRSATVYFDPLVTDARILGTLLLELAAQPRDLASHAPRTLEVPVLYAPDVAPDLDAVATESRLSTAEVIRLHRSVTYRVYMLGFTPGFPYLGTVPRRIAVPRLATPRKQVAAGSVGIAGRQTGIYPRDSPGGWRIIGRTPLRIFEMNRPHPFLLQAGDRVRFRAIDRDEFDRLSPRPPAGSR